MRSSAIVAVALALAGSPAKAHDGPARPANPANERVPASHEHTGGIRPAADSAVQAPFDIVHAKIRTEGNVAIFHMAVSGRAGVTRPKATGRFEGSSVFSYVWTTTIDPYEVGFERSAGILAPGQDLARYAADLIARFANPALNHRLRQIAMDGSQKIPQRWLETLAVNSHLGVRCPAILAGLGAWIGHLRGVNGDVEDPLTDKLATTLATSANPIRALFGAGGPLASNWQPDADVCAKVAAIAR